MRRSLFLTLASFVALAPLPVAAEVASSTEGGFVSHNEVLVAASARAAWVAMLSPADWWNGDHTYSGNPVNLFVRAASGGCFCETIPGTGDDPHGEIEHMRVVYIAPYSTLRMSGGLGPLQSEAVTGVLTMTLAPAGDMTRITWDYVVGGYMRMPMAELAPLVDRVVGEQLFRLAAHLGHKVDPVMRRR